MSRHSTRAPDSAAPKSSAQNFLSSRFHNAIRRRRKLYSRMLFCLGICLGYQTTPGLTQAMPNIGGRFIFDAETGWVALPTARLAIADTWTRIVAERADSFFTDGCDGRAPRLSCNDPSWYLWHQLIKRTSVLDREQRLAAVNTSVNQMVTYAPDSAIYQQEDHWATLDEIVTRGAGDCEDYAVAKMWLLAALDFRLSDMSVLVVKDVVRNVPHAVLMVTVDDDRYLLDSTSNVILRASSAKHYTPIYSVSVAGNYVYGLLRE